MDNDLRKSMNESSNTSDSDVNDTNSEELAVIYTSVGQLIIPEYEILISEAGGYGRY